MEHPHHSDTAQAVATLPTSPAPVPIPPDPSFTGLQCKAILLLSQNHSVSETARQCGVSRTTIYHWLRYTEGFSTALEQHRTDCLRIIRRKIANLAHVAVDELEVLLCNPDTPANVKLRVIKAILDRSLADDPSPRFDTM